jgi:hypothetical protein
MLYQKNMATLHKRRRRLKGLIKKQYQTIGLCCHLVHQSVALFTL